MLKHDRKNFLIVLNYYFPYVSGVSEYARSIATDLSEEYNVTVLCGKHDPSLSDEESIDGVRIVRCPIMLSLDKGYISPRFVSSFKELQAEADVINMHFPMLEAGLFAVMTEKPVILTYQCDMAYVGSIFGRAAVFGVRQSGELALKKADKVAVLSLDYAESSPFLKKHINKIVSVWPPNRFSEAAEKSFGTLSKENSQLEEKTITIGFVGRFVREKGIGVLLKAVEALRELPIKLRLVGDFEAVAGGSIYDEVRAQIDRLGDRVDVCGKMSDDELIKFYSEIDIIVLPSVNRFEAFGMVQIEAMGFGAYPVASNMPGVRSAILETGIGQLSEPNNAVDLANSIRRAVQDLVKHSRFSIAEKVLFMQEKSSGQMYSGIIKELSLMYNEDVSS